ncbi:hypothetical protein BZA70DRAFT_281396 [Myxozyma melibiosi]|uniref:Uncharacterized protein n=1 Tax=Myxozyma melibiosi TaxID=54550 RepID=A0ABR1F2K4_9ASCO
MKVADQDLPKLVFVPTDRDTIDIHYTYPTLHAQPSRVHYVVQFKDKATPIARPPPPVIDSKSSAPSNVPFSPVLSSTPAEDAPLIPLSVETVTHKIGDPASLILLGEYELTHSVFSSAPPAYSELESASPTTSQRTTRLTSLATLHLHNPSARTRLIAPLPTAAATTSDPKFFYETLKRARSSPPGVGFTYVRPAMADPETGTTIPAKSFTFNWEQTSVSHPQLLRGSIPSLHAKLVYVDPTVRLQIAELFIYNLNVFLLPAAPGYFIGADASRRYNELTIDEHNLYKLNIIADRKGFEVQMLLSAFALATAGERARSLRNLSLKQRQEYEASCRAARQAEQEAANRAAVEERDARRREEQEAREVLRRIEESERETAELLAREKREYEEKLKRDEDLARRLAEEDTEAERKDEEYARSLQAQWDGTAGAASPSASSSTSTSTSSSDKRRSFLPPWARKSKSSSSSSSPASSRPSSGDKSTDDARRRLKQQQKDEELARKYAKEDQEAWQRLSSKSRTATTDEFRNRPYTSAEI